LPDLGALGFTFGNALKSSDKVSSPCPWSISGRHGSI
jgi:hypothetical protein